MHLLLDIAVPLLCFGVAAASADVSAISVKCWQISDGGLGQQQGGNG